MPHISVLKHSNFLSKEDVLRPILVTITGVTEMNVAKEGAPEERKLCASFREIEKPLVLNMTNGQIIAGITKNEHTENWAGHQIVLYNDPNVSYQGRIIGGIRCRAPRPQAPPAAPPAPQFSPPPQYSPPPALATTPAIDATVDEVPF